MTSCASFASLTVDLDLATDHLRKICEAHPSFKDIDPAKHQASFDPSAAASGSQLTAHYIISGHSRNYAKHRMWGLLLESLQAIERKYKETNHCYDWNSQKRKLLEEKARATKEARFGRVANISEEITRINVLLSSSRKLQEAERDTMNKAWDTAMCLYKHLY